MLDDLDKTLENLLRGRGGIGTDIEIAFDQPNREWSSRLSRPTLNLYTFDIRENLKLRSVEREITRNGNMAAISRPARRIDVSYLVTAWARKIEDEHRLLWRGLTVLKRLPVIPAAQTEGALRYSRLDLPLWVAETNPNHSVNLVDLWSVLDNQMRLGFTLVITLELDLAHIEEAPLVLEATIRTGRTEDARTRAIDSASGEINIPNRRKKAEEGESDEN